MKRNKLPSDLVIVCVHVHAKTREAEYNKEDDSYICSLCRNIAEERGWKFLLDDMMSIHRSCLGV